MDNDNSGGDTTAVPSIALMVTTDLDIPQDQPFSVVYSLGGSPFEAIAFYDLDGLADTNDEFVLASGLSTGENQSFLFNTPEIPLGTYNIGIRATNNVGTSTQYATTTAGNRANIRVNGLPRPAINSPSSTQEVLITQDGQPTSQEIVFSCNDPEDEVRWELFYDTNAFRDGSGEVAIESGTLNAPPGSSQHSVNWLIPTALDLGTYFIGLTCSETSQSGSVKTVYANAQIILTDELSIPTLTVTSPNSDVTITPNTEEKTFNVTWSLSGSSPSTGDTVTVFVDSDMNLTNGGDIERATGIPPQVGVAPIDTSTLADSPVNGYFIGAVIERNGTLGTPAYASGKLFVTGQGSLKVTAPITPITVTPGTNVTISWNTSVPVGGGTVALTLLNADCSGVPGSPADIDPDPFEDDKELATNVQTASLDTSNLVAGCYAVEVRLTPTDASEDVLSDETDIIRVSTTPFTFWVGSIELSEDETGDPPLGHFDGLVFEGENFEDNAGSSLIGIGDVDSRDGDDFVIGARYAKPNFDNPGGIGSGAAYLVYSDGRISRGNRRFSLGAVGLDTQDPDEIGGDEPDPNTVPGLILTGIRFDTTSEDIDGSATLSGCFTEDQDGDGRLDNYDEDLDGDGVLDNYEDLDRDGALDINEDGRLWADDDCDGVADSSQPDGAPFAVSQFINGYLDSAISEDRDQDGALDGEGDATYGLTTLGLLPDTDADELAELAFGFRRTDSIKPTRGEDAGTGFATLIQPNQFERGGIVIVPTDHEPTIKDRTVGDRLDQQRIVDLDRAGQDFFNYGDLGPEQVVGPEDNTGTGIIGTIPENRPSDGMDAFPLVDDVIGGSIEGPCDEETQYTILTVNSTVSNTVAIPRYTITINNGAEQIAEPRLTPRTVTYTCGGCNEGDTIEVILDEVGTYDPEVDEEDFNGLLVSTPSSDDPGTISCGETAAFAIVGPNANGQFDAFGVCSGDMEQCNIDDFGSAVGCSIAVAGEDPGQSTEDGCYDTMLGPLFGFSYDSLSGGNAGFEDRSHPLAYDETLSNPEVRAQQFDSFAITGEEGPCNSCGKLLNLPSAIRLGSAPPFNAIASGFYPGSIQTPVGARILGRGVDDAFGASISSLTLPAGQQLALVSAPHRSDSAGVVYQWRMRQYWDELPEANEDGLLVPTGGLSSVDGSGGRPKPHQYIIKDLGFDTPNAVTNTVESSIKNALSYAGVSAGDELGARVLGIRDFNASGGQDLVLAAPGYNADSGAVYIVYNPSPSAAVDLADIARSPTDPERVDGMLIKGDDNTRLGEAVVGGCDLNDDGADDLVLGIPQALGGRGEVVIVYGCDDPSNDVCQDYLNSPEGGHSIDSLVTLGVAVRLQGIAVGDQAGFNVTCDGDFSGDGIDDLVFSAPGATPMYDSDNNDTLDKPGLDLNKDTIPDTDANGNLLLADPTSAGLIYVITNTTNISGTLSLTGMGSTLRGFTFVGAAGGDQLGGGVESKRNTRSDGLAYGGDLDGDGQADLLVGSILADPSGKTNAGEIYVIYGFDEEDAAQMLSE